MVVLAGVINCDIGVWESDLSTLVRDEFSGTMPPGAGTVIEMFPLSAWKGMTDFVSGGRVLLAMQPLSPAPAPAPFQHPAAASTPTSAPMLTIPASSFCSTVTAG